MELDVSLTNIVSNDYDFRFAQTSRIQKYKNKWQSRRVLSGIIACTTGMMTAYCASKGHNIETIISSIPLPASVVIFASSFYMISEADQAQNNLDNSQIF